MLGVLSYPVVFSTQFWVAKISYSHPISLFGYLVQMLVKVSSGSYELLDGLWQISVLSHPGVSCVTASEQRLTVLSVPLAPCVCLQWSTHHSSIYIFFYFITNVSNSQAAAKNNTLLSELQASLTTLLWVCLRGHCQII